MFQNVPFSPVLSISVENPIHPNVTYGLLPFTSGISELLICTTGDSRTVGMPISFMCACVQFVIRQSSGSTPILQVAVNRRGEDITMMIAF